MRYYIVSTDPRYVDAMKELKDIKVKRWHFFDGKIKELGFDAFGMEDFGIPRAVYKLTDNGGKDDAFKGPKIKGFKGGDLHRHEGRYYHRYEIARGGSAILKALCAGAPANPAELYATDNHFIHATYGAVFAKRFGLPDGVFTGRSILYATAYFLHDDTMVALSLPYRDDDSKEAAPAVIPDGFTELTERAFRAEIDKHNANLKEADDV